MASAQQRPRCSLVELPREPGLICNRPLEAEDRFVGARPTTHTSTIASRRSSCRIGRTSSMRWLCGDSMSEVMETFGGRLSNGGGLQGLLLVFIEREVRRVGPRRLPVSIERRVEESPLEAPQGNRRSQSGRRSRSSVGARQRSAGDALGIYTGKSVDGHGDSVPRCEASWRPRTY